MNTPDPYDSPAVSPDAPREISPAQPLEQLRKMFIASLLATLILAGSLNIFLLRQLIFLRKDLQVIRPQITQVLANYQKAEDPQIKQFINSLVNFGRAHPDFNPILAKYKIVPSTAMAPVAPLTPTGVPTVPPKKK